MVLDGIVGMIRSIAENEVSKIHVMELGIITSIFPHQNDSDMDNYECNVKLRDKGVELRKVPVATQHIGLTNMVHVGDLVLVSFINGNINSPVVIGRLYNDEDRPPINNQEEIIYKPPYSKNNQLRRLNIVLSDGTVNITLNDDKVIVIAGRSSILANSLGEISIKSVGESSKDEVSEFLIKESGSIDMLTKSNGKICEINLNKTGISLNTDSDIRLSSKGNMVLECEHGDLTLRASNIAMESKIQTKLSSASQMTIKGTPITLN